MSWLESFRQGTTETIPEAAIRRPDQKRVPCTADELGLPVQMDNSSSLVSVILPTYDDAQFLPAALESVGGQTYSNIELIIVDSTGVPWVETLADDRDWIRYTYTEPRGLATARNDGIEHASGEYIALLDADDYWHPEKIERQVELADEQTPFVYTGFYRVTFDGDGGQTVECWGMESPSTQPHLDVVYNRILAFPSTLLFRRDVVSGRPFEETLDAWEDAYFLVESFMEFAPAHIAEPLVVYRNRLDSMSADQKRMCENELRGLELLSTRYPELERELIRARADTELRLGVCYLKENEPRTARTHLERSIRLFPFDVRAYGLYVASLLPVDSRWTITRLRTAHSTVFE